MYNGVATSSTSFTYKPKHRVWGNIHAVPTGFLLIVLTSFTYAGCTSQLAYFVPDPKWYGPACFIAAACTIVAIVLFVFFCTIMEHGRDDMTLVVYHSLSKITELIGSNNAAAHTLYTAPPASPTPLTLPIAPVQTESTSSNLRYRNCAAGEVPYHQQQHYNHNNNNAIVVTVKSEPSLHF